MEQSIPTAAVYAGSLARTYEYRTPGVPTTPHTRWSFALRPGAQITCPILVSQDRVYVADSAGYLSTLDASSGDLVWSFPTDWVENSKKTFSFDLEGVTAFCLDGARGYVASAWDTLYELDLRTGQVLRSWINCEEYFDEEEEDEFLFDLIGMADLFMHQGLLFLTGGTALAGEGGGPGIYCFNPLTSAAPGLVLERGEERGEYEFLPGMYRPSSGEPATLFYRLYYRSMGSSHFTAKELSGTTSDYGLKEGILWSTCDEYPSHSADPLTTGKQIGTITGHNTPVVDEVLYAFGHFVERHEDGDDSGDSEERHYFTALVALDPKLGAVQWRVAFPESFSPIRLVAAANQIFLVAKDRVEGVDLKTRQRCWTWEAAFPVGHALVADGLLYVLGTQGEIIALDISTGAGRWNWQVESAILKDWSTIDNGTLYIATADMLLALRS